MKSETIFSNISEDIRKKMVFPMSGPISKRIESKVMRQLRDPITSEIWAQLGTPIKLKINQLNQTQS